MKINERAEQLLQERADGWMLPATPSFREYANDLVMAIKHMPTTDAREYLIKSLQRILSAENKGAAGTITLLRRGDMQ
jgi:hypothetical protein